MVGWHHRLNGHEFEQTLGDGEGQGRLLCCSPWGCKESDTTEQLNNNNSWGITALSAGQIFGGRTVPCYEVPKARGIPAPPPPHCDINKRHGASSCWRTTTDVGTEALTGILLA